LRTNVFGVFTLLEVSRRLDVPLVVHISTDEVYGNLREGGSASEDGLFVLVVLILLVRLLEIFYVKPIGEPIGFQ